MNLTRRRLVLVSAAALVSGGNDDPNQQDQFLGHERKRWAEVVAAANIKAE